MMKYDFDSNIERADTNSVKYDLRERFFGTNEVIPLWVADMDFKTPDFIIDAMKNRLDHPVMGYSIRSEKYNRSIVNWLKKQHQWIINESDISFCPGVVPGLVMAIFALTQPKDQIIVQPPVYFPFFTSVEQNNRQLVYNQLLEKDGYYSMDYDDLEVKMIQGAKMLILCNPHNPVGRVWSEDELQKIACLCEKYNVLILSDEIHADIVFEPNKHIPIACISEYTLQNTITFMAPSKTFNIAGLSTSFAVIQNPGLLSKYNANLEAFHLYGGNVMGTVASQAAFEKGENWRKQMLNYIVLNINYTKAFINDHIPIIKHKDTESTYLLWLDFRGLDLPQDKLVEFLIKEARIGLNDGSVFGPGGDGFMRLNVACPLSTLKRALSQLKEAIDQIK